MLAVAILVIIVIAITLIYITIYPGNPEFIEVKSEVREPDIFVAHDNNYNVSPSPGEPNRIILPLYFSGGYYKTQFQLSDSPIAGQGYIQNFQAIPDSGSHLLTVSGSTCQKCINEDGVWDLSKPGKISDKPLQIQYGGGQRTSFIPYSGYLVPYSLSSNDLVGNSPPNGQTNLPVKFGATTQIQTDEEQRPQNILGLAPSTSANDQSFLDSLHLPRRVTFDFPNQRLIIGEAPFSGRMNGRKHQMISMYPNQSLEYPFGKIASISIPSSRRNNQSQINLNNSKSPTYAVFDTGTNYSVINLDLYNKLVQLNHNQGFPSHLQITFLNRDHSTTSKLFSTEYITPGKVPISDTILLGAKSFDDQTLVFDYEDHQIMFLQVP